MLKTEIRREGGFIAFPFYFNDKFKQGLPPDLQFIHVPQCVILSPQTL